MAQWKGPQWSQEGVCTAALRLQAAWPRASDASLAPISSSKEVTALHWEQHFYYLVATSTGTQSFCFIPHYVARA